MPRPPIRTHVSGPKMDIQRRRADRSSRLLKNSAGSRGHETKESNRLLQRKDRIVNGSSPVQSCAKPHPKLFFSSLLMLIAVLFLAAPGCRTVATYVGASKEIAKYEQQIDDYERAIVDLRKAADHHQGMADDLKELKARHRKIVNGIWVLDDPEGMTKAFAKSKVLATAGGFRSGEYKTLPPDVQNAIDDFGSVIPGNLVQVVLLDVTAGSIISHVNGEIVRSEQIV